MEGWECPAEGARSRWQRLPTIEVGAIAHSRTATRTSAMLTSAMPTSAVRAIGAGRRPGVAEAAAAGVPPYVAKAAAAGLRRHVPRVAAAGVPPRAPRVAAAGLRPRAPRAAAAGIPPRGPPAAAAGLRPGGVRVEASRTPVTMAVLGLAPAATEAVTAVPPRDAPAARPVHPLTAATELSAGIAPIAADPMPGRRATEPGAELRRTVPTAARPRAGPVRQRRLGEPAGRNLGNDRANGRTGRWDRRSTRTSPEMSSTHRCAASWIA